MFHVGMSAKLHQAELQLADGLLQTVQTAVGAALNVLFNGLLANALGAARASEGFGGLVWFGHCSSLWGHPWTLISLTCVVFLKGLLDP